MKRRKVSFGLVLAVMFALVFSACGELDGGELDEILAGLGPIGDQGDLRGQTGAGGGVIFYYSEDGFELVGYPGTYHYLEAAPNDVGTRQWQSSAGDIEGTGTAMGTGRRNTAIIHAHDDTTLAASACAELNTGGRTDWFLPSRDELFELYKYWDSDSRPIKFNLNSSGWYWSSSQVDINTAWYQSFLINAQGDYEKDNSAGNVRAIRAF